MANAHSIDTGAGHGSVRSYVIGFVLSVVLTAAAFGLVMQQVFGPIESIIAIAVLAFIQILVHLVFFLHMNTSSSQRWNLLSLASAVLVAVILIGGTLWVLHNVGAHMMSR
ncbi:MAG: cytochrome o ubiquinol oxidase subunit [Caballeronia sp.]|jgi:cytochrome o ubiquinol oxidase subunit IV|uniref:cytochrome o ubiquinol oxidase subunit IV n=1 Tax=Caballeronia sp. TaxID=1931223 RepID=UPI002632B957|nr:cytochrome o ubiquinol oxidase subunit IV [Caballeronia sp.]MDB5835317.1 cytochrome o ubiquinol oxidase subunit [Caballeronia sp.]